jgi:hypothetical protein
MLIDEDMTCSLSISRNVSVRYNTNSNAHGQVTLLCILVPYVANIVPTTLAMSAAAESHSKPCSHCCKQRHCCCCNCCASRAHAAAAAALFSVSTTLDCSGLSALHSRQLPACTLLESSAMYKHQQTRKRVRPTQFFVLRNQGVSIALQCMKR